VILYDLYSQKIVTGSLKGNDIPFKLQENAPPLSITTSK